MSATPPDERLLDLVGTSVRVLSLRTRLLAWYDREAREMPWRSDPTPYHVLVSELMLQQTRVDVATPYFERWTARWPTLAALAEASEDDVLAMWSGLGYYRRARALREIAQIVVRDHVGELPADLQQLRALPGIGAYTAGAIASIAHGVATPAVDGNVERVVTRLLCDDREAGAARKRTVAEAARRLVTAQTDDDPAAIVPPDGLRAGDWNQALMDLGARICLPREPRCSDCPWRRSCLGHHTGLAAELPRRREKAPTREVTLYMALVRRGDHFLLVQRPEGSLLSRMWQLPTTEEGESRGRLAARVAAALGGTEELPTEAARTFRHTITNRRITVELFELELPARDTSEPPPSGAGTTWAREHDLRDFGVSSMTRKALAGRV